MRQSLDLKMVFRAPWAVGWVLSPLSSARLGQHLRRTVEPPSRGATCAEHRPAVLGANAWQQCTCIHGPSCTLPQPTVPTGHFLTQTSRFLTALVHSSSRYLETAMLGSGLMEARTHLQLAATPWHLGSPCCLSQPVCMLNLKASQVTAAGTRWGPRC